jgi:PAS domain S-box-containing protein
MGVMGIGRDSQRGLKVWVLAGLTLLSFVVVAAGLSVGVQILLAHLFYIPIILEGYWFHRKLPLYAASIGIIYLLIVVAFGSTSLELFTAGGRAVLFVVVSLLISYLSSEMHREEKRFSHLVDSVSDPLIWMTGEGTVAYVNDAYCSLMGTTPDAITGTSYLPAFFGDNAVEMDDFLSSLGPGSPAGMIESVITGSNGHDHVIQWNIHAYFTEDGTFSGSITIGRDIAPLREANKKLNVLSSLTRHDILNQVQVLLSYSELLEDQTPADAPGHEYIDKIFEATKRIFRQISFTQDYQDLGVEAPRWQVVCDACAKGAEAVDPGAIQISCTTGLLEIYADTMFVKVFYNLFDNAARHGETVTEIRIAFTEEPDGSGTLTVTDDGVGVPESQKEQIFHRGIGSNTGLGLFLIREVLSITGCSITEVGKEGEGACFSILIPAHSWRYASP